MLSRYSPSRSLRSSGNEFLTVPKARTKRHGEAAFSFYAPSLWNTLAKYLRMAETLKTCVNEIPFHSAFPLLVFFSFYFKILFFFTSVCNPPPPLFLLLGALC